MIQTIQLPTLAEVLKDVRPEMANYCRATDNEINTEINLRTKEYDGYIFDLNNALESLGETCEAFNNALKDATFSSSDQLQLALGQGRYLWDKTCVIVKICRMYYNAVLGGNYPEHHFQQFARVEKLAQDNLNILQTASIAYCAPIRFSQVLEVNLLKPKVTK